MVRCPGGVEPGVGEKVLSVDRAAPTSLTMYPRNGSLVALAAHRTLGGANAASAGEGRGAKEERPARGGPVLYMCLLSGVVV